MIKEYKTFNEETLEDALAVIRERFPPSAIDIAKKVLANPLRKICPDAGTIGYRDGRPVAFQAETPRLLYWHSEKVLGCVGGMTCKALKGCPLSVFLETIDRAGHLVPNVQIGFGNSCRKEMADVCGAAGGRSGPDSCTRYLWRAVRPLDCLAYALRRKVLHREVPDWTSFDTRSSSTFVKRIGTLEVSREMSVTPAFFDRLMQRYLASNQGLCLSRSAAEVDWMFGSRIRSGNCVLLCARQSNEPIGFIIVGSDDKARRWMLMDWFAVRNDQVVLETLLKTACLFLRKMTPAFMLETVGFPTFIQPLLMKYLPHRRAVGCNFFTFGATVDFAPRLARLVEDEKSWFFTPFDGDLVS